MEQLYFLSVLGNVHTVACLFAILIGIAFVFITVFSVLSIISKEPDIICIKLSKITGIVFAVSLILAIFIPSKEQLFLIYGLGGSIDYIKSNPKAKQLPDKLVDFMDAYLEKEINETKTK